MRSTACICSDSGLWSAGCPEVVHCCRPRTTCSLCMCMCRSAARNSDRQPSGSRRCSAAKENASTCDACTGAGQANTTLTDQPFQQLPVLSLLRAPSAQSSVSSSISASIFSLSTVNCEKTALRMITAAPPLVQCVCTLLWGQRSDCLCHGSANLSLRQSCRSSPSERSGSPSE